MNEYSESELDNKYIKCPHCGWEGMGSGAVIVDFFGVTDAQEIHCPQCDENLGRLVQKLSDMQETDTDNQLQNQM